MLSDSRREPTLKWLGLATSLPIMTVAGAFIGYYLPISAKQDNLAVIGVIIGAFGGFFLSFVELWRYSISISKTKRE